MARKAKVIVNVQENSLRIVDEVLATYDDAKFYEDYKSHEKKSYEDCLIEAQFKLKLNLDGLRYKLNTRPEVYRKSTQFEIDKLLTLAQELFENQ